MRLLIKSRVKQPGKRGGKYWYDKHGNVQYGEKPNARQRKVQTKTGSRKPLTAEEYKKHGVPEGAKGAYLYEKHDKYTHEWRDSRGKLQRKYQPEFVEQQQAEKYSRINNAAERIPELRESVNNDLNGKNRIKKYTALAVKIIDMTGARVGTEKHTQDFDTHGITTLEKSNLLFKGDIAVLDYIGKKKVHQYHEIDDPEVVEALRELKKLPGKRLFQIDNRGNISALAVNKYLSDYGLTAKDLRTFRANVEFTRYLRQQGVKEEKERKKVITEALKTVSDTLGNTPNVCRTNYISPEILDGYLDGKISLRFAISKGYDGKDYDELFTDDEQAFLDIWSEIIGKGKKEKGEKIEKSQVRAHQRVTSTGKIVPVRSYQNRKTKKAKPEKNAYELYNEMIPDSSINYLKIKDLFANDGKLRREFAKLKDIKVFLVSSPGMQKDKDGMYNDNKNVIYIRNGLTKDRFYEAVEHELIHAKDITQNKIYDVDTLENRAYNKIISNVPITSTKAFKKWFNGSKVVDKNGKPLVVYHGTEESFDEFDVNRVGKNTGDKRVNRGSFFTSDPESAESFLFNRFTDNKGWEYRKGNIMPVYLALEKPKIIDAKGKSINTISVNEFDEKNGTIILNTKDRVGEPDKLSTVYHVINPTQIKSAIGNKGTFNPKNPDITKSIRYIFKSQVSGHYRTTGTGKMVHVNPYQNTVVKKQEPIEMTTGIPLEMIERDEEQPREAFNQESLRKLGDSIKKIGLMQPIGVRPQREGKYKIIFGERRWRASRIAGLKDIPARVFNVKDKKELFAIQVAENLAREEMNPIETANAYKKLYDVGMNYEEIAEKIGVSPLTVQRKMTLTTLIPEIQNLIKNDDLSETKGILIGLAGLRSQFQFEVLKKINKSKKMSKEELDGIVSRYKQAQDQTSLFAMDNRSVITGVSQINKNKVESVKRQLSTLLGSVVKAAEKIIDKNNYKLAPAILKEQGKLKRTKDELKLLQTYLGTIVKELESADAFFHSGGTVDQYLSKQGVKKESRKKRRKRVKKSVLYLFKSVVKQHTRTSKTGKVVPVKQYINKKTKKLDSLLRQTKIYQGRKYTWDWLINNNHIAMLKHNSGKYYAILDTAQNERGTEIPESLYSYILEKDRKSKKEPSKLDNFAIQINMLNRKIDTIDINTYLNRMKEIVDNAIHEGFNQEQISERALELNKLHKSIRFFIKSVVRGHQRQTKTGKIVQVNQYTNIKTKRVPIPAPTGKQPVVDVKARRSKAAPDVSKPWQMTRKEYETSPLYKEESVYRFTEAQARALNNDLSHSWIYTKAGGKAIRFKSHRKIIAQALSEGKSVPERVLADYPDLRNKQDIPKSLADKCKRAVPGNGGEIHLSKKEVTVLLKKGIVGFISAGINPNDPNDKKLSESDIEIREKHLQNDLVKKGLKFVKVTGKYGEIEDSYMVMIPNVEDKELIELGKKYNQDSVIYCDHNKNKMIYTTGENDGQYYHGNGFNLLNDNINDYYTEINATGGKIKFSLKFDFDKLLKSIRFLIKSTVKAHQRKTKGGKIVPVKQYTNRKTKEDNGFKVKDIKSVGDFKDRGEFLEYYKAKLKKVPHPHIPGSFTYRPFVVGYGCDGSTDANIHYVAQKMCKTLGLDYAQIYDKAYGKSDGDWLRADWDKWEDEALKNKNVKDTTTVPKNATVQNVLDDLYDINNRSLVEELENVLYEHNISTGLKLSKLTSVKKSIRFLLKGKVFPVGHVSVYKDGTVWKKVANTGKSEKDWHEVKGGAKTRALKEKRPGIRDFGKKIGGARKDTAERGFTKIRFKKDNTESAWRNKYVVLKKVDGSGWTIGKKGDKYGFTSRGDMVFPTEKEAEKAIPLYAVAQSHRIFNDRENKNEYAIFKKVTNRKLLKVVNKTFQTQDDAKKYMAIHAEEILNLKTSFGEEILPVPEIAIRTGTVRRKSNATPKMFMKKFNPRGIEFGNWNNQGERQLILNHTYDGLLDLAEVLRISPHELMLNGELAIAFGARGQGLSGAKAHYERDYGVINLTKMKGAGSLAHEYFHALDHYYARKDTKSSSEKMKNERGDSVYKISSIRMDFLSHGASYRSKLKPEIKDVYKKLIETMYKKSKKYIEDKQQADRFVGKAKEQLQTSLDEIRKYLETDLTKTYTWRKSTKGLLPASAKQLAGFDKLANKLLKGGDRKIRYIVPENSSRRSVYSPGHRSNDTIESISKIYKEVRNRSGFNSQHSDGALDRVASAMNMYDVRLLMFEDANKSTEKTKNVPTSYAIEAKKMDQARVGDYWGEPHEMAARAFASYVEDKIAKKGNQSDFIVYRAHGGIIVPMIDGFIAMPYPEGKERIAINKEFDRLFKIIRD